MANGASIRGIDSMKARLNQIRGQFPDRIGQALRIETEIEATECKRRCPVDTTPKAPHPGNLRNSIHVEGPERDGRKVYTLIATGTQAMYAVFVHEDLEAHHPIGQAKFIESTLLESRPYLGSRIAARLTFSQAAD